MAAAGNLETDNAIVEEMSTALKSRMAHLTLMLDNRKWLDWATNAGVDYRITSYINFKPNSLYEFNPDSEDDTYACPRTWAFTDSLINGIEKLGTEERYLVGGVISEGAAHQFITFCNIFDSLPKIEDIVKNPEGATLPQEASVLFALTGSLSHHFTLENANAIIKYLVRMNKEFQVVGLRDIVRRHKDKNPSGIPAIAQWISVNATELFS